MKAIVRHRFGGPEVLQLKDVETPVPSETGVLIKVRASSVNPADWYAMTGRPWIARPMVGFRKPKDERIGTDFAGVVESVGSQVTEFQPGDEVYGMRTGAFAEYVTVSEAKLAHKPTNLSFEEAATVPVAGITALQGLRDHGKLQPGQKVLINGASGGVGIFAVQIAKALGGHVTGVCSKRNVEMVKSLGADRVVDYTSEDFTLLNDRFSLMIDNVSSQPFRKYSKILTPEAKVVIVGGPKKNKLLGPLASVIKTRTAAARKSQEVVFFVSKVVKEDMAFLTDLIEGGRVRPLVEKQYQMEDAAGALRHLGAGHVRSKLVVTIP